MAASNESQAINDDSHLDFTSFILEFEETSKNKDVPKWFKPYLSNFKLFFKSIVAQLDDTNEKVSVLNSKCDDLQSKYEVSKAVSDRLYAEKLKLDNKIHDLVDSINDLEQYSRRNCLLIHGVEEKDRENTDKLALDVFNNNLEINTTVNDICRSHRIGKKRPNKTRPIIVKFLSYRSRKQVFGNKRKLKGSSISVSESLTKTNYDLFRKTQDSLGKSNVWTFDGRICFKTEDDDKIRYIYKEEDLLYLL